ncbi:hypothetical protein HY029_03820 [Candidatus Gottesmanbacteria bacterium]|nr:hypothetical protein [Candidatus Gottesmanbacteria bacterium]
MKSRYIMIAGALVILAVIAGFLVSSQMKQSKSNSSQESSTQKNPKNETAYVKPTSMPTSGVSSLSQIQLSVISPTDNSVVTSPILTVKGNTKPNAELSINDKDTTADANGNFSTTLTLDEGENLIIITANDANGNVAEKEFTITYNVEG